MVGRTRQFVSTLPAGKVDPLLFQGYDTVAQKAKYFITNIVMLLLRTR